MATAKTATQRAAQPASARELERLVRPLRRLDNHTNLAYILREYLTLAAILVPAVWLCERLAQGASPWWVVVPVAGLAMLLVAGVQHRLTGLGHEGSHYILFRNRVWNELASDLFCMIPMLATTDHYRQIHFGHHEHTNDWEQDPELINMGDVRHMADFPMTRAQLWRHFGLRLIWPPAMARYNIETFVVSILGMGWHPYLVSDDAARGRRFTRLRITTVLGIGYLVLMAACLSTLRWIATPWQIVAGALALWTVAAVAIAAIPSSWFFRSQIRTVYSNKMTSALRLGWFTALYAAFAVAENATGRPWGIYFGLFWLAPMLVVLPYMMLLRDLVQHANCDDGPLTNSRNVFTHPLIRWGVFVYGQDLHMTHHLYPAIPHFRLPQLHRLLREHDARYARDVIECHGLARRTTPEFPSVLETIEQPIGQAQASAGRELHRHGPAVRRRR